MNLDKGLKPFANTSAYTVIDDVLKAYGFGDDPQATGYGAEILTVVVMAAKYFQNHQERDLVTLSWLGDVCGLSVSPTG